MLNATAFRRSATLLLAALSVASFAKAVETHIWDQSDQSDFTQGTAKQLSIRSDGHLSISPSFKELDSTTVPYLWSIVQDSKGTLYYAGGAPSGASTRILSLVPGQKSKTFAEISGLEIHSLAIDAEDRVYAAVQPDAKVYRIGKDGKPVLFFDPKQKYIWAMAFDKAGDLFVATGDNGLIYKVTPDGKGTQFANTYETHARSMIVDAQGNLIVGTEPNGLVMRIAPDGKQFVLYQTSKREVTAVAERDGVIYAAAVGNRSNGLQVSGPPPVLPSAPPAVSGTGQQHVATAPPQQGPALAYLSVAVNGGSDLYRIQADGFSERIWQSSSDLVYAICFDDSGRPLLGTGNKGMIYRVDSEQLSTVLVNAPPTQVTAFLTGQHHEIYAATGNVGNVYQIGPGMANSGTLDSDVLDAGDFSYWGKAHTTNELNGGNIQLQARSGNLNDPQHDWSPWTDVQVVNTGGEVHAPPARFLQYRLTLKRSSEGQSPVVTAVDIPFVARNAPPKIRQIEVEPLNYRESPSSGGLERTTLPSGSPITYSVAAVGQKRSQSSLNESSGGAAPAATLQYNKGFQTLRWNAADPNGDSLEFKVEVKPRSGGAWMTVKDKLTDRYYSIDTTALPDGEYIARITASDALANVPAAALTSSLESDPFTVDNTPPEIVDVHKTSAGYSFTAKDALNWIAKADYSLDGGAWSALDPVHKVQDSQVQNFEVEVPAGKSVTVRIFDDADNVVVKQLSR